MKRFLAIAAVFLSFQTLAQNNWITPAVTQKEGVFLFRKNFELKDVPGRFTINISADNYYRLYVNGSELAEGPVQSDVAHWSIDSLDIGKYLVKGKNTLAVVVWNAGPHRKWAQLSHRTALIVYGKSPAESVINSDASWRVLQNEGVTFFKENTPGFPGGTGPGEKLIADKYPWGWEWPSYNDSRWTRATVLAPEDAAWKLVQREIPFMEQTPQRFAKIRKASAAVSDAFIRGTGSLTIPAYTSIDILLDQGVNTTAFPEIRFSKGNGAEIKMVYTEALYDKDLRKAQRDETEEMEALGMWDVIEPDGSSQRTCKSLHYRTFRYVKLSVSTGRQPLEIHSFRSFFTAYPLRENAAFTSDEPALKSIWDVSWRTARLCAHDNYVDCPYWEQLQYTGDTRIQALVSLAVDGDDRLVRNAIRSFSYSLQPSGLTLCAYPGTGDKKIPPFSLIWVSMIYDHYLHRADTAFAAQFSEEMKSVLQWFASHLDDSGMLGKLPDDSNDPSKNWNFDYWNYVDATPQWAVGTPPGVHEGRSAIISLQYAYTLTQAARLMLAFGEKELSEEYNALSARITSSVMTQCFDSTRGLLADTPDKNSYSQHANIMAVLSNAIGEPEQKLAVMKKTMTDSSLVQASLYYRFYLHEALAAAGLGDELFNSLDTWKNFLNLGFTTFPEHPTIQTRSDCHAWSAHPMYGLLSIALGVRPVGPGYEQVEIAPNFGPLRKMSGKVPTPRGMIEVTAEKNAAGELVTSVTIPAGVNGTLRWSGKTIELKEGQQNISVE